MIGLASPEILHPDWYSEILVEGVRDDLPGIYEWRIEGVGCYIGQYTRKSRPKREYGLNIRKLRTDRPYRKGNKNGFRQIHLALHRAILDHRAITLSLLENHAAKCDRNRRERELIAQRRSEAGNGGLPLLNSV